MHRADAVAYVFRHVQGEAIGLSAEAFTADHPLVELASTLQPAAGPSEAGAAAEPRRSPRAARPLPDDISPTSPLNPSLDR